MPSHISHRAKMAKMRKAGLLEPSYIDPVPAREHAAALNQHPNGGMALRQIARLAGVSEATLSELINGRKGVPTKSLRRDLSEAILGVQYADPDTVRGARISSLGVRRRLGALRAIGYNYQFMATYMGHGTSSRSYIGAFAQSTWTHVNAHRQIDELYVKLRYVDPVDLGISEDSKRRCMNRATWSNEAPPSCWDDDTIDDPDAFPEWTGACGSMRGVRIHRKENILPLCPPCRAAQKADLAKLKEDYT